jgi:lipopolysaccharide transport system permease protein
MPQPKIITYEPYDRKQQGYLRSWIEMSRNILQNREIIAQLFIRDFFGGFKQSLWGIGWLVVSPILGIVSWVLMNSAGVINPGDTGVPYPVFVILGSTLWGAFMGFYNAATNTISSGSAIILQVKCPHEILLVNQVAQYLANFIFNLLATLGIILLLGVVPHWQIILLPLMLLPLFFMGAAIGLVISVVNIATTDASKFAGYMLNLGMYLTPIVYSKSIEGSLLGTIIRWNPLAYIISGARDMIFFGHVENLTGYWISAALSLLLFLISWRFFYVSERLVIEKLST